MLAQNHALGVIAASLLFGILNAGSGVLQMQMGLSKYFVDVLQFIVVLVLSARFVWPRWLTRRTAPRPALRRPAAKQEA